MPASWDDELVKAENEVPDPGSPRRSPQPWIVGAALMFGVAAGVALYVSFRGTPPDEGTPEKAAQSAAAARSLRPLGADAEPIDLPPLDQTDAIVRQLVRHLSTHPQVSAWLATDGLIRNFAVVVTNVAEGKRPAPLLRSLGPAEGFEVTDFGGEFQIDPRSYDRYRRTADAVASLDPAGSARLYTLLKPRIEEAYAELGNQGSFDVTLERAIVRLLDTPIPTEPVRVEPAVLGIGYRFADESLENLTAAQKQLLRMGPQNAHAVQERLRAIARALNIPAERLPAPE